MLDRFRAGLKSFAMTFQGRVSSWGWSAFPNGVLPYRRVLHNDAADSSLVMACLKWIQRTFPEAPIRIQRIEADGTFTPLPLHPMIALLRKPNPYYSGRLMMRALAVDYWWNGNAYLLKERAAHGNPVRLWYAPHTVMEPRWPDDGSEFLSHYDYKPDPTKSAIHVDPADVIHLRADIDPQNIRKGRSALASLVREIFTDDEAGDFTASLLRNLGVPGVVISPDFDGMASDGDALEMKQSFMETFSGDKRGQAMVAKGRTKVQVLSFSPQQMDLTSLRRIPEERVTAVLGIPAVVVGLGAGLDHATYNNVGQAREAAYESAIIPEYSVFADEMWSQLLPDFEGTPEAFKVDFDLSGVRVLQEDESAKVTRENEKLASGAIMVSEYRSALGYPTDTSHDIYLRDLRKVAVPKGDSGAEEAALAAETHGGSAAVADETGKTPPKALTAIAVKDQRQAQYLEMVARGRDATRRKAQRDLETTFRTASRAVIANLEAVAAREPVMAGYSNGHGETKISVHFPNLNLHDIVPDGLVSGPLTHIFAGIADNIGTFISGAVNALLGTNAAAPDLTAQAIERAGLLDADTQARDAVKAAIADGTAAGDSLPELTARVGDYVAAAHLYPGITESDGLQAAVTYRADLIACTEESIARASATAEVSRELGITHVLISDGPNCGWLDHEDPDLADNSIRTIEDYEANPISHPNCVRDATPWMEAPD